MIKYFAILCALCFFLNACAWIKPAKERVSDTSQSISSDYQKEVYRQKFSTNQGSLTINWKQGLSKMYLSNPELIQADHRIEDAKLQQKQIWRNMIPSLSVGANDTFTIGNIGDAFSNPVYRINSFISLGNLLDLPKNIYTRKLTYMGSELQAENTMRQQVIALYRLFQEQRLLKLEKKAIDLETELIKGISGVDNQEVIDMKIKNDEARENWEQNIRVWNTKVGDFFMTGYDNINLKNIDLPNITYKPSDLNFEDTNRWGMLQLNLLALEEIADQGRVLDAYFRYLPRANLSVSAPPLYSNTSNQSFSASRTRISPSLTWNLDTRGYIGQQIDRLKRESPIKQWRKDKRRRDEVQKLFEGKEKLIKTQKELSTLRAAMEGYKQLVREGLITDPEKAIRTMRSLKEREVRLAAREIEISSAFWLIDESKWTNITKKWLATREHRNAIRKKDKKQKSLLKLPDLLKRKN